MTDQAVARTQPLISHAETSRLADRKPRPTLRWAGARQGQRPSHGCRGGRTGKRTNPWPSAFICFSARAGVPRPSEQVESKMSPTSSRPQHITIIDLLRRSAIAPAGPGERLGVGGGRLLFVGTKARHRKASRCGKRSAQFSQHRWLGGTLTIENLRSRSAGCGSSTDAGRRGQGPTKKMLGKRDRDSLTSARRHHEMALAGLCSSSTPQEQIAIAGEESQHPDRRHRRHQLLSHVSTSLPEDDADAP